MELLIPLLYINGGNSSAKSTSLKILPEVKTTALPDFSFFSSNLMPSQFKIS